MSVVYRPEHPETSTTVAIGHYWTDETHVCELAFFDTHRIRASSMPARWRLRVRPTDPLLRMWALVHYLPGTLGAHAAALGADEEMLVGEHRYWTDGDDRVCVGEDLVGVQVSLALARTIADAVERYGEEHLRTGEARTGLSMPRDSVSLSEHILGARR